MINIHKFIVFFSFALLLNLTSNANSYYFSASGNDGYSSSQAQNPATPWQSIAKLNSFFGNLGAGDVIYFNRGDRFYGSIVATTSGTSGNPIVISAYGSGNSPVITGLTTLTSWSSLGNGVYSSSASGVKNTVNLVNLNGKPQQVGRYPNTDATNGGYLTYETSSGTSSITDDQLSNSPNNWTGAEVVIRKQHYLLERCLITGQSGNTISYTSTPTINPANGTSKIEVGTNGFGYFIQRDPRTLDQLGEWYFNPVQKNMQMFFGNSNPASYNIQVSTVDTLVNLQNNNYINISNLSFEGANFANIYAKDGGNINVQNCNIVTGGAKGIFMFNCPNVVIDNVSTNYVMSNAIDVTNRAANNVTITNCNITNTGIYGGMGSFWENGDYKGIFVEVNSTALIQYNNIDHTGYIGIHFQGNNISIKNNFINYYSFVTEDGGGIYTYCTYSEYFVNREIRDNIVLNGIGAPAGTGGDVNVQGVYLDGSTMNVDVLNNSVANIGTNGFYCNNPSNVKIQGNTSFNNGNCIGLTQYSDGPVISNFNISNNVFFPKYDYQNNFFYANTGLNVPYPISIETAMQQIGYVDNNYVNLTSAAGFGFYYKTYAGGAYTFPAPLTFNGWKAATGHDQASRLPPVAIPTYKLNSLISSNSIINGQFNGDISSTTFFTENNNNTSSWDNTGKLGSGGSLKLSPSFSATNFTYVFKTAGSVTVNKNYIVRFSTVGSGNNGIVNALIRQTNGSYTHISNSRSKAYSTSRQDNEFLLTATASEGDATLQLEFQQTSGATYIDDIQFYEADVTPVDINAQLRFEYNASKNTTSVPLDANYIGVDGTSYNGSITLQPYTSKVLIRNGVATTLPLSATASAGAVSCFGGTVNVIVSATGGTGPFTGTGNFATAAGPHTFIVTDASGATASAYLDITQPSSPLQATSVAAPITSFGGFTTIGVSAQGGTAPYTGIKNFYVNAGTYTYVVTDANGCSATTSITVSDPGAPAPVPPVVVPPVVVPPVVVPEVVVPEVVVAPVTDPGSFKSTASATPIRCFGESSFVTISGTGGTPPYSSIGTFTAKAGVGSLKISFPASVSEEYTSLYSSIGSVSSSKKYVVRFSTLGTTNQGLLRVYLGQSVSPYNRISNTLPSASFGTNRVDHEFIFNSLSSASNANVVIEVNQNSGTTYINNIAVFELGATGDLIGTNILSRGVNGGQFETDINNISVWSPNNNQSVSWDNSGKISNTYYFTVFDAIGLTSTSVVNPIPSSSSSPLLASSYAAPITSAGGFTTIGVNATGGTAPYTGTGFFYVAAGTYAYTVTDANGCTATTSINLADQSAAARVANTTTSSSASIQLNSSTVSGNFLVTSYPNPSTSVFNLKVQGGSSEKVYISVMSYDGKLLYQTVGSSNSTYSFGSTFAPGIYTVLVKQGIVEKTLKLIKG